MEWQIRFEKVKACASGTQARFDKDGVTYIEEGDPSCAN
jgi:hypothetical protein